MTTVAVIDSKQAFPFGVVQDGVVGVLEIEIATITSIVSIVFPLVQLTSWLTLQPCMLLAP